MASITKRNGKWFVQVRRHGHSLSKTFTQKKDAETWAKQLELELERQELPQNPKEKLKGITLGQLVERYKSQVSPRKKSCKNEQIALDAFLRHDLCKKPVAGITASDFAAYRDERLSEVQPATLKRELTILQNVFEIAKKEWGMPLKTNPVAELGFTARVVRRDRRLQDGELGLIIEDAKQRRNPYILPLILMALETGMRRGELLEATWHNLNLRARTLFIPDSKNSEPRTIPLSLKAIEVLEGLDPTEDRIFPVNAGTVKTTWHRMMQKLQLPDLNLHDLWHECISNLFDRGLHIGEVSSISGHKTWSQLKTYTQPKPSSILAKLDAGISNAA